MDELVQLCTLLASADKAARQQAEERYKQLRSAADPSQLLRGLLHLASTPAGGGTAKTMACVLLRQLFDSNVVGSVDVASVDPAVLAELRAGLSVAVANESNAEDRRKLCHVLAQAAAALPEGGEWPELLQLMAQLMGAERAQHRETGFELLDKVAEYQAQLLVPFAASLPVPLLAGLQAATAPTVRLAALKATCSVALEMGTSGVPTFQPLVGPLLQALEAALKGEDATAAQEAIAVMSKLTEDVPKLWREALPQLGPMLAAIVGAPAGIECAVRIAAIEWVSTLAEKLPARFRRGEWLGGALLPALVGLVSTPPPQEEGEHTWAQRPDSQESFADLHDGEDEEEELAEAAALALDRLSHALGGKIMYKECAPLLLAGLQNAGDWTQRRGALLSLGMLADGCDTSLQAHLPQLLPLLVSSLAQDPHPRVRYAFLACMTQLCEDLPEGPDGQPFQVKFGSQILPALTLSLADPGNQAFPRIQAAAAGTVASFCSPDKCSPKVLGAHLEALLRPLFGVLGTAPVFVKEEAMTAVATLAQVSEEAFSPFYDTFVPIAKQMLAESTRDSDGTMGLLGMKALEAFALMGDACGREAFRQDAHEVLQLMAGFQQQSAAAVVAGQADGGELQHETTAYVMNSTARIGTALGAEFAPYLSNVLPLVLAVAAKKPQYHVQKLDGAIGGGAEEKEAPTGDQTISVQLRGEGRFEVHVNSWEIQQREIAAQSLMHYVTDVGGCLGPYLSNILEVVLELIHPTATPEVRVCAYGMLPKLLRCSARKQDPALVRVLDEAMKRLLVGLSRESELADQGSEDAMEILCVGADTLALCLEAGYESVRRGDWLALPLGDELVQPLFELLQALMVGTIRRRIAYQQETEVLDADDADLLERREEWEQGLLNSCQETVGWVLRLKGEGAVSVFQAVLDPLVAPLLAPGNSLELRLLGLCLYIDVLEFGGRPGAGVAEAVAALALDFLSCEDEDAQQTAAYAVGVLAQCGGEVLTPALVAKMLPLLLAIVVPPQTKKAARRQVARNDDGEEDDDDTDGCVRDNAISSVLRLCRYRGTMFDAQQLLHGGVLRWLPLTEDLREAHSCHQHFVEWVSTGDPALFGAQGEHLPTMVAVLAALMVDPRAPEVRAAEAKLVDDGDAEEDEDKVFGEQYVSKQTRLAIEAIFAKLQTAYRADALAQIWAALPEEYRQAVQTPTASVFTQRGGVALPPK